MKKLITIISALLLMSCASSREIVVEDYPEVEQTYVDRTDTIQKSVYFYQGQYLIEKDGVFYALTGQRVGTIEDLY